MTDAYQCEACEDLNAGLPGATVVLPRPIEVEGLQFEGEVDLCPTCLGEALATACRSMPEPSDTTYEQNDSNGDREWDVSTAKCHQCGNRYPSDYTRCNDCGAANHN